MSDTAARNRKLFEAIIVIGSATLVFLFILAKILKAVKRPKTIVELRTKRHEEKLATIAEAIVNTTEIEPGAATTEEVVVLPPPATVEPSAPEQKEVEGEPPSSSTKTSAVCTPAPSRSPSPIKFDEFERNPLESDSVDVDYWHSSIVKAANTAWNSTKHQPPQPVPTKPTTLVVVAPAPARVRTLLTA